MKYMIDSRIQIGPLMTIMSTDSAIEKQWPEKNTAR